ncbi:MAG: hypothetical protein FWH11_09590 [Micrococcales bacterium]|nr:hypothetical protein [Micrococcales bacterium]
MATEVPADESVALRDRWQAASLESVWLRPGDWYHPAVDPLARAVATGAAALEAAEDLGRARADAGVGVGEAVDDLVCLYRTSDADPPLDVLRALATGWADGSAGLVVSGSVVDPTTGLPSGTYLGQRLAETYGAAERDGTPVRTTHALTVVDVAVDAVPPLLRAARSAAVGAALRAVFGTAEPMAALGTGVAAVLTARTADLETQTVRLRAAIMARVVPMRVSAATRHPVRIWQVLLPPTHTEALALLRRLARP